MSEIFSQPEGDSQISPRPVEEIFQSIIEDGKVTGANVEDFEELESEYMFLKGKLIEDSSDSLREAMKTMIYDGFTINDEDDYKVFESLCRMTGVNGGVMPSYDFLNVYQNSKEASKYKLFTKEIANWDPPFSISTGGDGYLNVFSSKGEHIFDIQGEELVFYSRDAVLPLFDTDNPKNNNNAEYIAKALGTPDIMQVMFPSYEELTPKESEEAFEYNTGKFTELELAAIAQVLGVGIFDQSVMRYITDFQSYKGLKTDGMLGPATFEALLPETTKIYIGDYKYDFSYDGEKLILNESKFTQVEQVKNALKTLDGYVSFNIDHEEASKTIRYGDKNEQLGATQLIFTKKYSGEEEFTVSWDKTKEFRDGTQNHYIFRFKNGEGYKEYNLGTTKEISDDTFKVLFEGIDREDSTSRIGVKIGRGWERSGDWGKARVELSMGAYSFGTDRAGNRHSNDKNGITRSFTGQLWSSSDKEIKLRHEVSVSGEYTSVDFTVPLNNASSLSLGLGSDKMPYLTYDTKRRVNLGALLPIDLGGVGSKNYMGFRAKASEEGIDVKVSFTAEL